ncbi:MAG: T9SS type A sorting domain-containing protein [Cyclobacteriaceae bacterium]
MKLLVTLISCCFLLSEAQAQTSSNAGSWTDNANWTGSYPGTLTVNAGDDDLALNNETISVAHYIILGASDDRIDANFANSNNTGSLSIQDEDTLIIYGDIDFANKSMDFNIGTNSVVVIMGDATFANKVDIATTGTLVVSGNFNKAGSQGSYTGGGAVYAGSYSGNADAFIPGDVGSGGDQQQTIDDLSDDGFPEIETFVDDGGEAPLPVELIHFSVKTTDEINLSWATATEINNDYFVVERSEDGEYFYEIGRVIGHGNSTELNQYSFIDKFAFANVEYYRLTQFDYDGQSETFHIVRVEVNLTSQNNELTVYPTVVSDNSFTIKSTKPYQINQLSVYSLDGKVHQNLTQNSIQENPLTYRSSTIGLPKGSYVVNITTSTGEKFSSRIKIR